MCHADGMEGRRSDPTPFAVALRTARLQSGLSQRDLARKAGIDPDSGYISLLEYGWTKRKDPLHWQEIKPRRRTIDALANALRQADVPKELILELYRARGIDPPEVAIFATALRATRERVGLSQRDLAMRTKISQSYLSGLETGRTVQATPQVRRTLDVLVRAMGIEGAEEGDALYVLLGFDPPDRIEETAASNKIRGLPSADIDLTDLGDDVLLGIERYAEQEFLPAIRRVLDKRRGSVGGGAAGSGRAKDHAQAG